MFTKVRNWRSVWAVAGVVVAGIGSGAFHASSADAAVLHSAVVADISGPSDVINTDDTIYAYNFGTNSVDPVVNGVTFTGVTLASGNSRFNDGTATLSIEEGRPGEFTAQHATAFGPGNMTGDYGTLLSSAMWGVGTNWTGWIGLSGLEAGEYVLQYWINDPRDFGGGNPTDREITMTLHTGEGIASSGFPTTTTNTFSDLGTIKYNAGDVGDNGQFITIHFTLQGDEDTITIQGSPMGVPQVNAFQLRLIPEPASLALLALGGLMMLWRRRQA